MDIATMNTTSTAKTLAAIAALRARAEADDRYLVEDDTRCPGGFRIYLARPDGTHGGQVLRVQVYEGYPVEIFDGGRRYNSKLSVATANRKLDYPHGTFYRQTSRSRAR